MSSKKLSESAKKRIKEVKAGPKFNKFKEEIEDNTETEIHIKSDGSHIAFKLYGSTMDVCKVLVNCFKDNEKFFAMVKASVAAYTLDREINSKDAPEAIKEFGKMLSALGKVIN